MDGAIGFTLAYEGNDADGHAVDFYDVSQALISFQRTLALTAHLILNEEIITQAPALKGARILALPAEPGSWKITAWVLAGAATAVYNLGTAQSNSPLGHLMFSLYDYVVKQSLGVHVDYNKSLGQLYEQAEQQRIKLPIIHEHQVDSLTEKTERAFVEMHRPISKTHSAISARIIATLGGGTNYPLGVQFDSETFDFIHDTRVAEVPDVIEGRVSSYNSNTYKGRIYVAKYGRPVPFELAPYTRSQRAVKLITTSLSLNATKEYNDPKATVHCVAFENTSRSGRLKSLTMSKVSDVPINT